ncbi:MAG: methylmalonyl-CoA mutase, partial [Solirubrobacterales bacterium]|nr:methylmalonyl-CoA mutase [Solirubrobacterales bacterium]
QQVIAHETGGANTVDPLGGSWFVESLTDEMEADAYDYFRRIDELGGMVEAIRQNFPQREIGEAAFRYQLELEAGQRQVVGVNAYREEDEEEMPILHIDPALEAKQLERLEATRGRRDQAQVDEALARLREVAAGEGNLMFPIIEASRALATEGEMISSLQDVFGTYSETPVF